MHLTLRLLALFILFFFALLSIASGRAVLEKSFRQVIEQRDLGNTISAIQLFEQVLIEDADLHRVRLELAVSYFQLREYETAEQEL